MVVISLVLQTISFIIDVVMLLIAVRKNGRK